MIDEINAAFYAGIVADPTIAALVVNPRTSAPQVLLGRVPIETDLNDGRAVVGIVTSVSTPPAGKRVATTNITIRSVDAEVCPAIYARLEVLFDPAGLPQERRAIEWRTLAVAEGQARCRLLSVADVEDVGSNHYVRSVAFSVLAAPPGR